MKTLKLLLLFSSLFLFSSLTAQTQKGSLMVGGNVGFSSQSQKDVDGSLNTLHIAPMAGYFFADRIAGGVRVDFTSVKFSEADDGSTYFNFGPFLRYYTTMGIFGELAYQLNSQTILDNDSESGSYLTPRVGYAAFLNDHVSIEPSVYYAIGGGDLYEDLSTFGIDIGFNIYLH